MGDVYLSGVYTPPLVRQTARMGRHCRYWVPESNTPYASTDASIGGSAGFWECWSEADAAIQRQPGSRAWGEDWVQRGMVSGAGQRAGYRD
jgi:hypothetical protein